MGRLVIFVQATNRVRQSMAKMHPSVTEANACHGTGEMHVLSGLVVLGVFDSPFEVFGGNVAGVSGPDVAQRIASLQ